MMPGRTNLYTRRLAAEGFAIQPIENSGAQFLASILLKEIKRLMARVSCRWYPEPEQVRTGGKIRPGIVMKHGFVPYSIH